jgi:hypothetical protein
MTILYKSTKNDYIAGFKRIECDRETTGLRNKKIFTCDKKTLDKVTFRTYYGGVNMIDKNMIYRNISKLYHSWA